jgi:hypothetical protein
VASIPATSCRLNAAVNRSSTAKASARGKLIFLCPTITGQPRRAGDSKFETDLVEALRCNGWFGSFFTPASSLRK